MELHCAINKNWTFTVHLLVLFISNMQECNPPKLHDIKCIIRVLKPGHFEVATQGHYLITTARHRSVLVTIALVARLAL